MAVYVDKEQHRFGRMKMCHMLADSETELVQMAKAIGLKTEWLQRRKGGVGDHFDICTSKRKQAVRLGAVEIDRRKVVELLRQQRGSRGGDQNI